MKLEPKSESESFAQAGSHRESGLIREMWEMLRQNRKWWLMPILIVFLIFGGLLILGSTGAAPFIYALF